MSAIQIHTTEYGDASTQNILDAVKKRSSMSARYIKEQESLVDRSNQIVKKQV